MFEAKRRPEAMHIIQTNSKLAGLEPEVVISGSRSPRVYAVRSEIQAQSTFFSNGFPYTEIGAITHRNHATVIHAVRRALVNRRDFGIDLESVNTQSQDFLTTQFPALKEEDLVGRDKKEKITTPRQALIRHLVLGKGIAPFAVSQVLDVSMVTINAALGKDADKFNDQVLEWKRKEETRLKREEEKRAKERKAQDKEKRDRFVAKAKEMVAAHYMVSPDEMISRSRKKRVLYPRQTFQYIMFMETELSLGEISRIVGRSDHTVSLNAIRSVEMHLDGDADFRERMQKLREEIKTAIS